MFFSSKWCIKYIVHYFFHVKEIIVGVFLSDFVTVVNIYFIYYNKVLIILFNYIIIWIVIIETNVIGVKHLCPLDEFVCDFFLHL